MYRVVLTIQWVVLALISTATADEPNKLRPADVLRNGPTQQPPRGGIFRVTEGKRIGPPTRLSKVWRQYAMIGNLKFYAGEFMPFINSPTLYKTLEKAFENDKAIKVQTTNQMANLSQDLSVKGIEEYNSAIDALEETLQQTESEFVDKVLQTAKHAELRLLVMVIIKLRHEMALDNPFVVYYWKLSDADVQKLKQYKKLRQPNMDRVSDMMGLAAMKNEPRPKIPEELLRSEWQLIGKQWSVLDEPQLVEFLKYARKIKPNTSFREYLEGLPELATSQLSANCDVVKQVLHNPQPSAP